MGGILTKYNFKKKEIKVIMLGIWGAGRTSILYRLKLGELVEATPTIGFNFESIQINNMIINIWDIGALDKKRQLRNHYYQGCNALIFVIDCSLSKQRIIESCIFLRQELLNCPVKNISALIYVNKEQISKHSLIQIEDYLDIKQLQKKHKVYLQLCSAVKNKGLLQGLQWVTQHYLQ